MAIGKAVAAVALLLVVASVSSGAVPPAPGGAPSDLNALAARLANAKTQPEALQSLAARQDPTVEPLLRALKDGALYQLKDKDRKSVV